MLRIALVSFFFLLVGACGRDSDTPDGSDLADDTSSSTYSDPRIDAAVIRIFEVIRADDAEFAAELELSALLQLENVGDSIGAASEQIYGQYARKSSDVALNLWLDNMVDDFRRVRDQYPDLCNGYMNGSPGALAQLYDRLFTVEDKLEEVEILESIVLSAISDPTEIGDFDAVQNVFDELMNNAEDWAEANDALDECNFRLKLFSLAQDLEPSLTADLMRYNFTY